MPDPFEQMGLPATPIDPDPIFAGRLRDRLAGALAQPKGTAMTDLQLHDRAAPPGSAAIHPYIAVAGAASALEWYADALGARVVDDPIVMPDGRIGHAELDIGGARLMLSDEYPEIGVEAVVPGHGTPVTLYLSVADVDAILDRAVSAGAELARPAADYPYGRNGVMRDPFGHRWMVSGPVLDAGPRQGDIGYVSLWVPDVGRAATFFSDLLGWRYRPGSGSQGRQVEGLRLHHGMWGGVPHNTLFCCFAVESIGQAVARVREAGGVADEPELQPWGLVAGCTDDQGVAFAVFEPPGGVAHGDPVLPNGAAHGDLAYVTMEVRDSAKTRAFYGSVLGWSFTPGRVDDGWGAEGVVPMVGISGGHDEATNVPMYRVDDIVEALDILRDVGGSAEDAEEHPYGTTALCTDDQGTRFYLGQL